MMVSWVLIWCLGQVSIKRASKQIDKSNENVQAFKQGSKHKVKPILIPLGKAASEQSLLCGMVHIKRCKP